jgi:hypothetical protein
MNMPDQIVDNTTPSTDEMENEAKRGIVFVLKQLLANPSTAGYLTKALQWGLGLAGAKVSALTDDGLYQAAGWIVTGAMAAWAFYTHAKRNRHITDLTAKADAVANVAGRLDNITTALDSLSAAPTKPTLPPVAEIKGETK